MNERNMIRFTLILSSFYVFITYTKAQVNINLNIIQPPVLVASVGTNQAICAGDNISIVGDATGGREPYAFSWSPSSGLSSAIVADPVASPSETTTYTLTVTDANNCESMASVVITVNPCNTGINNTLETTETGNFNIVPNPNRGSFSVVSSPNSPIRQTGPVKLEIYNILGKKVYETFFIPSLNGEEQLSPFGKTAGDSGIYLVKISFENIIYTEKLIIE